MHEKDWLDSALRDAEEPLSDAGFTLRVMQALPLRERREQRHDWILYGAAAASSAVVAVQFPVLPFLRVVQEAVQITWLGALVMLGCMAGGLLAEPLRRML
jgi:hypothetical protein